jgi:hypothetical protein
MIRAASWPRLVAAVGAAAAANALVAFVLAQRGGSSGAAVAVLPALLIAVGAIVASDRRILLGLALGLGFTFSFLTAPLPIGGKPLFVTDIVVLLALGAAGVRRLIAKEREAGSSSARTPVLGWPLLFFALAVFVALLRGHARYGQTLFGSPLRVVFYAGIAAAILHLKPLQVHRTIVAVFYGGAVWMLLNSAYFLATGKHQTDQIQLSTGGTRVLSLSVAILASGSLFLALLNLTIHKSFRLRALDFAIANIALFEIVLAFGRTTFIAVAAVLPLLCIGFRDVRSSLLTILPLTLPILIVTGIYVTKAAPPIEAVLRQFHQSPLIGVGFGRQTTFTLDVSDVYGPGVQIEETISQDPHDSYVWLLAGGGILLLSSFLLLVLAYLRDAWLRLRGAVDGHERVVIIWAVATLFVYLTNTAAGPVLGDPPLLLVIWTLLVLPAVVPRRRPGPVR